jgi:hypothetical protein
MVAYLAFDTSHSVNAASRNRLAAYRDEHLSFAGLRRRVFMVWFVEGRGHFVRGLGGTFLGLPAVRSRENLGIASIIFVIGNAALPELKSGVSVRLVELICDA